MLGCSRPSIPGRGANPALCPPGTHWRPSASACSFCTSCSLACRSFFTSLSSKVAALKWRRLCPASALAAATCKHRNQRHQGWGKYHRERAHCDICQESYTDPTTSQLLLQLFLPKLFMLPRTEALTHAWRPGR